MPYASVHQNQDPSEKFTPEQRQSFSSGKSIARVYGYMGIGLAITGVVAFLVSWLFSSAINTADGIQIKQGWLGGLVATWLISAIVVLILSFVIPIKAARGKSSLWVPYILYAVAMGFLLSIILLSGIDFYIIGEAFAITALSFTGMFMIGWFSKRNLSWLSFVALNFLWMLLLTSLIGGITFAVRGNADGLFWFDIGIQAAIIAVILLVTAVDTWRIRKILETSDPNNNLYLYGAYIMYTDFISVLIRVIYILSRTQNR